MKKIKKIVVHFDDNTEEVTFPAPPDEIEAWLDSVVYLDSDTKERRTVLLDQDRDRFFFFAEPLDFDKDDTPKARFWLDEIEGYNKDWHKELVQRYG